MLGALCQHGVQSSRSSTWTKQLQAQIQTLQIQKRGEPLKVPTVRTARMLVGGEGGQTTHTHSRPLWKSPCPLPSAASPSAHCPSARPHLPQRRAGGRAGAGRVRWRCVSVPPQSLPSPSTPPTVEGRWAGGRGGPSTRRGSPRSGGPPFESEVSENAARAVRGQVPTPGYPPL